ncbi:TRAP transporter small permease [Clostridium sp.]|uniref:TRAP transporter small permease n=1 Tax=Clostridium sp. TaxID=1506 RepID=UPI001A56893E|nr:TRAP transporter small permease subunit [Clostridium sp.]MBK5241486.1 TRAP transporter small permease subunit [Clostridium sp.]
MIKFLEKFNDKSNKVVQKLLIIIFILMTVFIFLQVIFRYVLKSSLSWSEELSTYLFIWLTFLGASVGIRNGAHIKVMFFVNNIKNIILRKCIITFSNSLSIIFLIILSYYGTIIANQIFVLDQISASMPFLRIGVVYFAIPIGSILMTTNLLEITINVWSKPEQIEGGN